MLFSNSSLFLNVCIFFSSPTFLALCDITRQRWEDREEEENEMENVKIPFSSVHCFPLKVFKIFENKNNL